MVSFLFVVAVSFSACEEQVITPCNDELEMKSETEPYTPDTPPDTESEGLGPKSIG